VGIVVAAVSGLPGLFFRRSSILGQWLSTFLAVVGAALGLTGVATFWAGAVSRPIVFPWAIPGAEFHVAIDGLSAIFLMPIFLISLLGNVYGLDYWKQTEHPDNGRKLRLFYGALTAGMGLLVIARNSILFIFGWEIMALSAFLLVATEDEHREVRETSWIYLVSTHMATLCLFGLFALLRALNGSGDLVAIAPDRVSGGVATMIFILALFAFGLKAGAMPLHIWLPSAHAITPSHVSAIMSGVIIKMGIYGLIRVTSLFPEIPLAWGVTVLAAGVTSGVLGVAFAIGQHDLKRLLAYHSIENIGIILMGLGLALIGRSLNRADWVILGLAGCLLHVWNHALFKSLLFLSAGSVIHAVHTREIDHLGGLAKLMPWTSRAFLVGAVAICGLPPLNGFVSEFLIYLGLFGTLSDGAGRSFSSAAFAAPALALIGALAVACFVKVFGAVFLGAARSAHTEHAHEAPPTMLGPMAVLVSCCFLIGLLPVAIVPILGRGIADWAPNLNDSSARLVELAPLGWVTIMAQVLLIALVLAGTLLAMRLKRSSVDRAVTWDCGYVAPTSRMQYTSSSFAEMLVGLFAWVLRPRFHRPKRLTLFARTVGFHSEVADPVLDEAVLPAFRYSAWFFSWFRVFQQGNVQMYLLYIFIALIALLLWH
jgi:hydrogenase-4 component B